MEDLTRRSEIDSSNDAMPSAAAYWWLAGISLIVFAVIYISLIIRVHFLTSRNGISAMTESSAYAVFAFSLLMILGTLYMYIIFSRRELLNNLREPAALMFIFTIVVVSNIFIGYYNPYGMFAVLVALLSLPFCKRRDAFVLNMFATFISSFFLVNILDDRRFAIISFTGLIGILGGAIGAYAFPNTNTRFSSVLRALLAAASEATLYAVLLCTYLFNAGPLLSNLLEIMLSVSAEVLFATALEPVIEWMFNITTDFKLIELTKHNAPLIHRLSVEAPGTFNHSLAVANFAEICASAIGEDPYLARACAYYHDVGKLNNSMYFTENQSGYNPHDDILPEVSAEIIRQHTVDGYELCKKNRIPEEIARVTIEHHGTLPIIYFYNKAKTLTDGEVNMDEYRYRGETPRNKIAAIIMICDVAEAAIRAMDKPDGERVDKFLKSMIDERIALGQFDNCAITMRDLNAIRNAIVVSFGGLFHKRIKYNTHGNRGGSHD